MAYGRSWLLLQSRTAADGRMWLQCLLMASQGFSGLLIPASACLCLLLGTSWRLKPLEAADVCLWLLMPAWGSSGHDCLRLLWASMAAYACSWLAVLPYAADVCLCPLMLAYGCFWPLVAAYTCLDLLMVAFGGLCLHMPAYRCLCLPLPAAICCWLLLGTNGCLS